MLFVTSKTTLAELQTTLLEALVCAPPTDLEGFVLPAKSGDIALWRLLPKTSEDEEAEEADEWELLDDEKSGCDKWGL